MDATMELILIKTTENELEFEVHGENETFLVPLLHRLLENPKVDYATYLMGHILMDQPRIYVRVIEGTPEEALDLAAEGIRQDLTLINEQFVTQMAEPAA